jgi:hypothetical protein
MHQPDLPGSAGFAEEGALRPQAPSGRLAALLEEHERLLTKIARRRQQLEAFREEVRAEGARLSAVAEPLRERFFALDAEVHALFAELMARRLPKQDRVELGNLYQFLKDQEVLSPAPGAAAPVDAPPEETVEPAERREPSDGLRELFLGLANALHPDKAQSSHDLAERTEMMKEVNRAYQEGDLARLLEIERAWSASRVAASADEMDRRCQALERTNAELRAQLRQLTRAEKSLRASRMGRVVTGRKRPGTLDPVKQFQKEAKQEIDRLTQLRDHLRRFRDGKISFDQLLAGPPDANVDLFELGLITLETEVEAAPRRRRRKKR